MAKKPGWLEYQEAVLTGQRNAGKLERLSVDRCVALAMSADKFLDVDEVERVVDIVGSLRHTKGKFAGQLFQLMPWQEFFLAYLFGLKYLDTRKRVFRNALLCVPKKNGKSEFAGAIGVLMTFFDGEDGAECYSAANKYDQAMFSWDAAKKMVKGAARESAWMNSVLKVYDSITTRSLINQETESFFKPIAADAKTLDGVNPHLAIIDEYHEAKDSSVPDNLESGMVAREQPLLLTITTRGFNVRGPLWQLEKSYINILEGLAENDQVFPMIYCLDDGDAWDDPEVWEKANPGIGRTPTVDGLMTEFNKAKTQGQVKEINFRTKNLNEWTTVQSRWMKKETLLQSATEFSWDEMQGCFCFCGLDLAKNRDLTAITYLFPPQAHFDKFRVLMRVLTPEESAKERQKRDQVPYLDWAKAGWLELTSGNSTDFEHVLDTILNDSQFFDVRTMYYDPYEATHMAQKMHAEGLNIYAFRQSASLFNAPIVNMENTMLKGNFDPGQNPMIQWFFDNVVPFYDTNGNIKFDKRKSREKIDGAVALAMSFAGYLNDKSEEQPQWQIVYR